MDFHYEKIDHIQLAAPVGSEAKSREFYHGLLGLEEVEKPAILQKNGGVWFKAGDVDIHIGIEEPFTPAKKAHPAIRVRNIKKMVEYLASRKVDYEMDDKLPGASRFYVWDPFGNRIEFLEWNT
ncbi:VOC family protein [Oceanobacillus saliphilus]|uniref:VOC family protein n=1 Tax=Oceanobacillus saliphilus TaxID=2925834 RepID=UPI00201D43C4|nr:VOC family protein [Oceanobacillus saliphilus]